MQGLRVGVFKLDGLGLNLVFSFIIGMIGVSYLIVLCFGFFVFNSQVLIVLIYRVVGRIKVVVYKVFRIIYGMI